MWAWPAVIDAAPVRPVTATGVDVPVVVPFPNCPVLLLPQHLTAPPVTIAHVWLSPAVIDVAPVRPVTATGVAESVVVPFPNSPVLL